MQRRTIAEYVVTAALAVALALAVQAYVIKPYRIPSASMAATLRPGDHILVDRMTYLLRQPHRGDIVVFHYPPDPAVTFVKRIVGLPGDTLVVRDGRLYVNGHPPAEPYVHRTDGREDGTYPGDPLDGSTMHEPWSLLKPYKVPRDSYFVMGDNRLVSDDSRDWGIVPRSDIIGGVVLIYWPLTHWRDF